MERDKRHADVELFKAALLEDIPTGQLSSMYQTAMQSEGRSITSAQVTRTRRGLGFRVTIELPRWARIHVDQMEGEAQSQMEASIRQRTLDKG